jgi:hypothetical protein
MQISTEMQNASTCLRQMIISPTVVAFDFPKVRGLGSFNVVNECVAAKLMEKVIHAVSLALFGAEREVIDGEYVCVGIPNDSGLSVRDTTLKSKYGLIASTSVFSPARAFSQKPYCDLTLKGGVSLDSLLRCLSLTRGEVCTLFNAPSSSHETYSDDEVAVQFTIVQYHSLLDLFGSSMPVKAVLEQYFRASSSVHSIYEPTIHAVHDGLILNSLNLSVHPTVSCINQLDKKIAMLGLKEKDYSSFAENDAREEQRLVDLRSRIGLLLQNLQEAKQAAVAEDFVKSFELLLDKIYLQDENELFEIIEFPVHLRVAHLLDR